MKEPGSTRPFRSNGLQSTVVPKEMLLHFGDCKRFAKTSDRASPTKDPEEPADSPGSISGSRRRHGRCTLCPGRDGQHGRAPIGPVSPTLPGQRGHLALTPAMKQPHAFANTLSRVSQ